jgi:hypothetical protein
MTFKHMQLTITLRRLDPQFPVGSLPFGKSAPVSAGIQNRKTLTRMQFVELFGPRFVLEGPRCNWICDRV